MKYYKVLSLDGAACHGGNGQWHFPRDKRPGKWMPLIADINPCVRGYHLCRRSQLIYWLGPALWIAEGRGEKIDADDKTVFGQARLLARLETWNDTTARLFAADCAARVAHLANDKRCDRAIVAARLCAFGDISSAAWAAAWAAARDAARDAAWAAWAAARDAAWAARDAARDAARAAARAAERRWQTRRLFMYLDGKVDLERIRHKARRDWSKLGGDQ